MDPYSINELFGEMERELVASYKKNMAKHAQDQIDAGFEWPMWQAEKLKDLQKYKKEAHKIVNKYTHQASSSAGGALWESYKDGVSVVDNEIGSVMKSATPFFKTSRKKVDALLDAVNNDYEKAGHATLRLLDDQYRQIIFKSQVMFNSGAKTLPQAIDMAAKDFLTNGINCIQYANGNKVNIASYAEMVLRTSSKRAMLTGQGARLQELGIYTVRVSTYGGCSETCLPWQGRVFVDDVYAAGKPDGKHPLLSTAMAEGLYHPNCRHTQSVWIEELEDDEPTPVDVAKTQQTAQAQAKQRHIERQIRKWKRVSEGSIDPDNIKKANKKVQHWQEQMREFLTANPELRRKSWREKTYGIPYKPTQLSKVTPAPTPKFKALTPPTTTGSVSKELKDAVNAFDSFEDFEKDVFDLPFELYKELVDYTYSFKGIDQDKKLLAAFNSLKIVTKKAPPAVPPVINAKKYPAVYNMFDEADGDILEFHALITDNAMAEKQTIEVMKTLLGEDYDKSYLSLSAVMDVFDDLDDFFHTTYVPPIPTTPKLIRIPTPKPSNKLHPTEKYKNIHKLFNDSLGDADDFYFNLPYEQPGDKDWKAWLELTDEILGKNHGMDLSAFATVDEVYQKLGAFFSQPVKAATSTKKAAKAAKFTLKGQAKLGGTGEMLEYVDEKGKEWLFKPAQSKSGKPEKFRAYIQEAASKLQYKIDKESAVQAYVETIDGKFGAIQEKIKTAGFDPLGDYVNYGDDLPEGIKDQLLREYVTDWLLGNYDAHHKNFVLDQGGNLIGVDKEQSFKYLFESGSQKMSYKYHPNAQYGEAPPIYNKLFKDYADDNIKLDLKAVDRWVKAVEKIPDDEYVAMFKAYTEEFPNPKLMQDSILIKKKNLRKDLEEFFSQLESEKQEKPVKFKFEGKAATTKKPKSYISNYDYTSNFKKTDFEYLGAKFNGSTGKGNSIKDVQDHSDWCLKLSNSEKEGINAYSGSSYNSINSALRADGTPPSYIKEYIDSIDEALKKAPPLSQHTVMYRHFDMSATEDLFNRDVYDKARKAVSNFNNKWGYKTELDELKKLLTGGTFSDPAYLSSSYAQGVFVKHQGVEVRFYLPEGSNYGVLMEEISDHKGELEYLMGRDLKFKIVDIEVENVLQGRYSTTPSEPNLILHVTPF